MGRYFPELIAAARQQLPPRCVVDGEVVLIRGKELDFEALQLRLHPAASRVELLSVETPASLIAFDLLALGDEALVERPFAERRAKLVEALDGQHGRIYVTPLTDSYRLAERWFRTFEGAGLDGVVAKPRDLPYAEDQRVMFKVKHARTADCVVAGFRWYKRGPVVGSLLLGLHDERGELQHVGVTSSFSLARRQELLDEIAPYRLHEGARTSPGSRSAPSWSARSPTTTWRAGVSGIPPISSAGAPTATRPPATTSRSSARWPSTWPRSSPATPPEPLVPRPQPARRFPARPPGKASQMVTEYQRDALRFERGRPVSAGDQALAEPTHAVRTGTGFWGLFAAGEDLVVVVHPAGAIIGRAGELRERLEQMATEGGLDAEDQEAVSSFLPFLGKDDPGAARGVQRSHVRAGVPPTYWVSGTMNSPPGAQPATRIEEAEPGPGSG